MWASEAGRASRFGVLLSYPYIKFFCCIESVALNKDQKLIESWDTPIEKRHRFDREEGSF